MRRILISSLLALFELGTAYAAQTPPGSHILTPIVITAKDGRTMDAERGLFFAPENRAKANSNIIPIHFIRFPAKDPSADRPPVFLLPGGPGSEWKFDRNSNYSWVEGLRRTRDVIYVSQRGNYSVSNMVLALKTQYGPIALDQIVTPEFAATYKKNAAQKAVDKWTGKNVDLAGYDILNIVDDVYEMRQSLGYDKIMLSGCSFGSQWSMSYIKRWPETVERALLGGVEPLDYAYDSPKWLWASMTRLAAEAEAYEGLKADIPEGGLMNAVKAIIERLSEKPVVVTITHPRNGENVNVTVTAEDYRNYMGSAWAYMQNKARGNLAHWPRHIIELYNGDYRYLAARTAQQRLLGGDDTLITLLIDNSIGITAERDAKLLKEEAAKWLGDINDGYHATRGVTPTPLVPDSFRADWDIDVPVLLLTGSYDWSTPKENAHHTRKFLKQGHLLEVTGGTHCTEFSEVQPLLPDVAEKIFRYVSADFTKETPAEFFKSMPSKVSLPPIEFASASKETSLYDEWLVSMKNR